MATPHNEPVTLDDALLGITLLESLVDAEKEDLFERLTDDFDMYDLFRIYSQLCMLWLITEADDNNQSYREYINALRGRMITNSLLNKQHPGDDEEANDL